MIDRRQHYKIALSTPQGEKVCEDLVRRYIMADPVKSNEFITAVNLGKQRMAIEILKKVYTNERDFRLAMEKHFAAMQENEEL